MEIIDKHFIKLSLKRKVFVISLGFSFFIVALIMYITNVSNIMESFLIFVIGMLFVEMIKLEFRLIKLEKK